MELAGRGKRPMKAFGQQLISIGINQLLVLVFNGTQKENQTPDTSSTVTN